MDVDSEIAGKITEIETIAIGRSIHELPELQTRFGRGRLMRKRRWTSLKLPEVCETRAFSGDSDEPDG